MRRLLSLLLLLAACGKNTPAPAGPPPDELTYTLWPSTRVIEGADLAALSSSTADGVLTFKGAPASLDGVVAGSVILAGPTPAAPTGLLRIVLGADRTDDQVVLHTTSAPLQVAFKQLHAKLTRSVDPVGSGFTPAGPLHGVVVPHYIGGSIGDSKDFSLVIFDGDGDDSTTDDQVLVDATLGGNIDFDLTIDLDWGKLDDLPGAVKDCLASLAGVIVGQPPSCSVTDLLPEVKTTFEVEPALTLDANLKGVASLSFERDLPVGTTTLPPLVLGPLVLVPAVDILAHVEGGASARFTIGAQARASMATSVTISSRTGGMPVLDRPHLKDLKVTPHDPTLNLEAHAEVSVGARLSVELYGVAGPYATASAVVRINAAPLSHPCWDLHLALEAELGARITSPELPIIGSVTLAEFHAPVFTPYDEEVAHGDCLVPPDPPNPPGGGPTEGVLAAPTFTPWAHNLGGFVDGGVASVGELSFGYPDMQLSVDGRYLAAGGFALAAHKIDPGGALTWTSRILNGTRPRRVLASAPGPDAGIALLLSADDGPAFDLAFLDQGGGLRAALSVSLTGGCSVPGASAITSDGAGGWVVVGRCASDPHGFLVHLDSAGRPTRALLLSEGLYVIPKAAGRAGDATVIAGTMVRTGQPDDAFVAFLGADDHPGVTTAVTCPAQVAAEFLSLIPARSGGVIAVGDSGSVGLVARIRADGGVGFVQYPNVGAGVAESMAVTGAGELPTGGILVAAAAGRVTSGVPPAVVLVGLDAAGSTLWARDYHVPDSSRALVWPSLHVTDDGGALVTAIAGPAGGRDGDLFAMKVFARDGTLGDGTDLASDDAALSPFTCETATRSPSFKVDVIEATAAPRDFTRG